MSGCSAFAGLIRADNFIGSQISNQTGFVIVSNSAIKNHVELATKLVMYLVLLLE